MAFQREFIVCGRYDAQSGLPNFFISILPAEHVRISAHNMLFQGLFGRQVAYKI